MNRPLQIDDTARRRRAPRGLARVEAADYIGVYIVTFETFAKIGFSKSIGRRVRSIEEHLPADLTLRSIVHGATLKDERILHHRFDHLRLIREWFRFGPDLEDLVAYLGPPRTAKDVDQSVIDYTLRRIRG